MFVCCECCVLPGRGLCDELITCPEESYRMWCVVVWSRNLKNEKAMTQVGSQRHRKKCQWLNYWIIRQFFKSRFLCNLKWLLKSSCQQYGNKAVWRQHKDREENNSASIRAKKESATDIIVCLCLGDAQDGLERCEDTSFRSWQSFSWSRNFCWKKASLLILPAIRHWNLFWINFIHSNPSH